MKPFETSLPMVLYHTLDAVMPPFRAIFARFGITEQQWRVLRALWEQDGKPLLALAEKTLIQPPSLVGVVDRLQRDGLVERRRSRQDRRVVRVCLTGAGKALRGRVTPLVDAAYSDLESTVSESEWAVLLATLRKVAANAGSANGGFGAEAGLNMD
ncbi:MAG: MarR family transcriptional regulator [Gammaproteobacteria bacterium]|nr:MarR family transcriptional regulator [Gammaproteobacteria bacterium]